MLSALAEFPLPTPLRHPGTLTVGPDGNLWFPETLEGGDVTTLNSGIGRITPSGVLTEFPLPAGANGPGGLTVGPDGNLWFAKGSFAGEDEIGRISPSGNITLFPLPAGTGLYGDLMVGPDGNLWFTGGHVIGWITQSGAVTLFPLPEANGHPGNLVAGADGNLWFIAFDSTPSGGGIRRITPSGALTDFPIPASNGHLVFSDMSFELTPGPDGNFWFTENFAGPALAMPGPVAIGRITPSGAFTQFLLPGQAFFDSSVTVGSDGNLWFTKGSFTGHQIGRITPSGALTEFPLPPDAGGPNNMTVGPDGNLWSHIGGQIDRITPSGILTQFPLPGGSNSSGRVTFTPDGSLWFTDDLAGVIGRIDLSALRGTGVVAIKHSRARITAIVLGFDEALDPRTARESLSYNLAVGMLKRHSSFSWKGVKIAGVSYHRTKNTVRLKLARPHKGPLEVTVRVGFLAAVGASSFSDFTGVVP